MQQVEEFSHLQRLSELEFLVIDEADRMVEKGHFKELEHILNVISNPVTAEEEKGLSSELLEANLI